MASERQRARQAQIRAMIALMETAELAIDRDVESERKRLITGRYTRWVPPPLVRFARERIHARLMDLRRQLREVE